MVLGKNLTNIDTVASCSRTSMNNSAVIFFFHVMLLQLLFLLHWIKAKRMSLLQILFLTASQILPLNFST